MKDCDRIVLTLGVAWQYTLEPIGLFLCLIERGEKPMSAQAKENVLQASVDNFITKNPALATALDLFKISNEQYRSALEPLQRPELFVTNSANDADEVKCLAGPESSKK